MYHLTILLDKEDEKLLKSLSSRLRVPKSKIIRKALAMYGREPVMAKDPVLKQMRPRHVHTLGYAFPFLIDHKQTTPTFLQIMLPEGEVTIERCDDGIDVSVWPFEPEYDENTEPVTAVYVEYDDMLELWRESYGKERDNGA